MEKRILLTSTLVAFLGLSVVIFGSSHAFATQPNDDDNHKVTICHRTNSITNPYVIETVDVASVDGDTSNDNGNGDHLAEHTGPVFDPNNPPPPPHNGDQWGDIIPPFYADGTSDGLPSLNWPAGQSIFENDCNLPDVTPTVTPTPTTDPCIENEDCVTPTATPTPTQTITPTPTTTSNGGGGNGGGDGLGCASHDCSTHPSTPTQAVLGASTMASTGTFEENTMNLLAVAGIILMSLSAVYAKAKANR